MSVMTLVSVSGWRQLPWPLFRITIQPTTENGLHKRSQVMADKAVTVRRDKLGPTFGRIDADSMVEVERCLAVFLGIAK